MFKGMVNRMVNGNPNKQDYGYSDMPRNRLALFFRMLKEHIGGLFLTSLIMDIFAIVPITWFLGNMVAMLNMEENAAYQFNFFMWGWILCCPILTLGLSGLAYVTRNWSRDRTADSWSDFWYGISLSWKQSLVVGLLNGLMCYLLWFDGYIYAVNIGGNFGATLAVTSLLLFFLLLTINIFLLTVMVSYQCKLTVLLKNAVLLTFGKLPKVLCIMILIFSPFLLVLFSMNTIIWILAYYMLFGFGLTGLIMNSFANGIFDEVINPNIPGAPVREGLRPSHLDEYGETVWDNEEDDWDVKDDGTAYVSNSSDCDSESGKDKVEENPDNEDA